MSEWQDGLNEASEWQDGLIGIEWVQKKRCDSEEWHDEGWNIDDDDDDDDDVGRRKPIRKTDRQGGWMDGWMDGWKDEKRWRMDGEQMNG